MKLTKEDLDLLDQTPPTREELREIIRLARLGLWVEERGERALNFIIEEAGSEDQMWSEAVKARADLPKPRG